MKTIALIVLYIGLNGFSPRVFVNKMKTDALALVNILFYLYHSCKTERNASFRSEEFGEANENRRPARGGGSKFNRPIVYNRPESCAMNGRASIREEMWRSRNDLRVFRWSSPGKQFLCHFILLLPRHFDSLFSSWGKLTFD